MDLDRECAKFSILNFISNIKGPPNRPTPDYNGIKDNIIESLENLKTEYNF